jgi:HAD superfamily hydrolase (TIGR01509 family)
MKAKIAVALAADLAVAEGVIFDMDGVVSDTQTIHAQTESELLRRYGIAMSPEEITREFGGVTDEEMFPQIFGRFGKHIENLNDFIDGRWRDMVESSRGRVRPMAGALELVTTLRARSLPLAVASSSRRAFIDLVLEELKIRDMFDAIVSAGEVTHGKPDPAIFLLAAKRLGIHPRFCVVIEDSVSGMRAAKRAGMHCVGLIPPNSRPNDYPADLVIGDLRELSPHFH